MGRTRMGRTDGLTDGRTRRRLYAPPKIFGEHKNVLPVCDKPYHTNKRKVQKGEELKFCRTVHFLLK